MVKVSVRPQIVPSRSLSSRTIQDLLSTLIVCNIGFRGRFGCAMISRQATVSIHLLPLYLAWSHSSHFISIPSRSSVLIEENFVPLVTIVGACQCTVTDVLSQKVVDSQLVSTASCAGSTRTFRTKPLNKIIFPTGIEQSSGSNFEFRLEYHVCCYSVIEQ